MNQTQIISRAALCFAFATFAIFAPLNVMAKDRPNVVFIIADDASKHFGETYQCDWVKTPNIDGLARQGLAFDNAYVPTSKCAPCRAAILTGRNPWQNGQAANHQNYFPAELRTFTEALRDSGYRTLASGKVWGPGIAEDSDGKKRNFALKSLKQAKVKPPEKAKSVDQMFGDFLSYQRDDSPFFYWHGSSDPHRPYDKGAGAAEGKKPRDIDHVPAYWPDNELTRNDMLDYATEVERFDAMVGDFVRQLKNHDLFGNTIVVVTSDHGMPFPRVKGHTYDDAHRVPMVISWPEGIVKPGRRIADLISVIDLAPTFLTLAGIAPEASGMEMTGQGFIDLLENTKPKSRPFILIGRERNDVFARVGSETGLGYPVRAIRKGDYLLVHNLKPERWPCGDPELGLADTDASPTKELIDSLGSDDTYWKQSFGIRPEEQLFNVVNDPDCVVDLIRDAQSVSVAKDLRETMTKELVGQKDPREVGGGDAFDHYPAVKPATDIWKEKVLGLEPSKTQKR